jgi:hypothetical protein
MWYVTGHPLQGGVRGPRGSRELAEGIGVFPSALLVALRLVLTFDKFPRFFGISRVLGEGRAVEATGHLLANRLQIANSRAGEIEHMSWAPSRRSMLWLRGPRGY